MNALRERNYRLLFIGQSVSSLGNNFVPVALAFAVLKLTHSASDLGLVLGAEAVSQLCFLLVGGLVADRLSRRSVMVSADLVRSTGEIALGLSLIFSHPSIAWIASCGAIQGLGAAFFTPASSGLVPSVVSPENLRQANALRQTMTSVALVVGPAVAGICVASIGAGWAIVLDGLSFLANVAFLLQIQATNTIRREKVPLLHDIARGWRVFWGRDWFRALILGASLFNMAYGAYVVLGPTISLRAYHGPRMWVIASASSGVGSIVGALLATRLHLTGRFVSYVPLIGLYSLLPTALALHFDATLVAVAGVLGGAGLTTFGIKWQTTVQRQTPEELLSRASSYDYLGSLVALPIGLTIAGPISALVGLRQMLLIVAGIEIAVVLVMSFLPSVRRIPREEISL